VQADLIHMGAKYSPCMRDDTNVREAIESDRAVEQNSSCCLLNDGSGCVQTVEDQCSVTHYVIIIIIIIIRIIKWIYTRRLKAEVTRCRSFNQSNKCVFSCALNCSSPLRPVTLQYITFVSDGLKASSFRSKASYFRGQRRDLCL